jgi:hypothetical protein
MPISKFSIRKGESCAVPIPYGERKMILCINRGGDPNISKGFILNMMASYI